MQTSVQTRSFAFKQARNGKAPRRATVVVRAQRSDDLMQQIGKHAVIAAAALVLSLVSPSKSLVQNQIH